MAEPGNHTLHILREFREEFRAFRDQTAANFDDVRSRMDNLRQAVNGESVLGRYAAAEVEERPGEIERRLTALEKAR